MRYVNLKLDTFRDNTSPFYINYEVCKYFVFNYCIFLNYKFYINYEVCKSVCSLKSSMDKPIVLY